MSSTKWVQFFTDAGLPSKLAAKYAVIFNEHRIQNDMLKDLSKEILYDMGVKTMGDVIAILRHAKEVDEEESKAKVLAHEGSTSRSNNAGYGPTSRKPSPPAVSAKSTPSSGPGDVTTKFARRLGPSVESAPKRTIEDEFDFGLTKTRRHISPPRVSERVVVKMASSSKPSGSSSSANRTVFDRLGGGGTSKSESSLNQRTVVRLNADSVLLGTGAPKATATVKPTTLFSIDRPLTGHRNAAPANLAASITGSSVKDRLGSSSSSRTVASSNLRFKHDPPVSKPKIVQLQKNIFDRLGS